MTRCVESTCLRKRMQSSFSFLRDQKASGRVMRGWREGGTGTTTTIAPPKCHLEYQCSLASSMSTSVRVGVVKS